MATPLLETLTTLITSLTSATSAITAPEFPSITPPNSGISLLDVKNELLLSYLHNAVFLILVKLQSGSLDGTKKNGEQGSEAVEELVKLRLLLEKGVKPLEAKLKYQIDKVVAAAIDDEISKSGTTAQPADPDSIPEDDIDHDDYGDYSRPSIKPIAAPPASTITNKELSFRPNPLALAKPAAGILPATGEPAKDGVYRPPRISATSMPGLQQTTAKADKQTGRRKSHMLDEFVAEELSMAPMAQPSIGSTIVAGGRVLKSSRERREEQERRDYEESNFVRLPQPSKKEMRERKRNGGGEAGQFGGEDWRDFAGDLDRLTRSAEKGGKSSRLLEKSRKRRGEDEEGNGGRGLGENFERRRKSMESRAKKRKV